MTAKHPQPRLQRGLAGEKLHVDPNGPKRRVAKPIDRQLGQILARAKHGRNAKLLGPASQSFEVAGRVFMVIGKLTEVGRLATALCERVSKARRIADAAKRRDGLPQISSSGFCRPPAEYNIRGEWTVSACNADGAWRERSAKRPRAARGRADRRGKHDDAGPP